MKLSPLFWIFGLLLALTAAFSEAIAQKKPTQKEETLLEVGKEKVSTQEFSYAFEKNNPLGKEKNLWQEAEVRNYLELYINFKLKVLAAQAQQLDTAADFKNEYLSYREQLAQPYLTLKNVSDQLVKEAYTRLQEQIRASHILIRIDPYATAADTLAAYQKISDIRKKIVAGMDFNQAAMEYSEDTGSARIGGDLGYFTALQMIYPFENQAYQTPEGKVSEVFRTKYGYHILKVFKRKPTRGSVRISYLYVRSSEGMATEDTLAARKKTEEIYRRLQAGDDWDTLVKQFSDDVRTRNQGGELPWQSPAKMQPVFEDALADLEPNQISPPLRTPFGWYILKLLERKPLEPLEEIYSLLEEKVARDSRAELQENALIEKLKKENRFSTLPQTAALLDKIAQAAQNQEDSTAAAAIFAAQAQDKLFQIADQSYSLSDFKAFLDEQGEDAESLKTAPDKHIFIYKQYELFVKEAVLEYEKSQLEYKYPEFRFLTREYHDGILIFKIMEEKVWSKALTDEAGLQAFFEQNRQNYKWKERAIATIYDAADAETLQAVVAQIKRDNEVRKDGYANAVLTFKLDERELDEKTELMVDAFLDNWRKQYPEYGIRIRDFSSPSEDKSSSKVRQSKILDLLRKKNVPLGILEIGGETGENPDKSVMTLSINLDDKSFLEKKYNQKNPLQLKISKGKFERGTQEKINLVEWASGIYTFEEAGRHYCVHIERIEPERQKDLSETRGVVISDYQNHLEREWVKTLRQTYPFKIDEKVLKKLLKQKQK
ncbi:peptidylprolyl isomerase [Hugenholtzia roseola]|uniref:peptidylprolyl isomerase n=1 Tax=Hugenholtzia roseola TaxID=1002 RepID=UPI0004131473|nr:peptidylprolyl isomerase [Hugenholtzia roseola]